MTATQIEFQSGLGGSSWHLSQLQIVASGGEANDVKTCEAGIALFEKFGEPCDVIMPGFGLTKTYTGVIFNLAFPDYDLEHGNMVASLGKCIAGIEMLVVTDSRVADRGIQGDVEVRSDVFGDYYRNSKAPPRLFLHKTVDSGRSTKPTSTLTGTCASSGGRKT